MQKLTCLPTRTTEGHPWQMTSYISLKDEQATEILDSFAQWFPNGWVTLLRGMTKKLVATQSLQSHSCQERKGFCNLPGGHYGTPEGPGNLQFPLQPSLHIQTDLLKNPLPVSQWKLEVSWGGFVCLFVLLFTAVWWCREGFRGGLRLPGSFREPSWPPGSPNEESQPCPCGSREPPVKKSGNNCLRAVTHGYSSSHIQKKLLRWGIA